MTPEQWSRVQQAFDAVLSVDRADRERVLDEVCGTETWLRREVASLLAAHDRTEGFLDRPVYAAIPELIVEPSLPPGHAVGPYIVRHEIGRGGMGIVYLADDTRLGRPVALKACGPMAASRHEQLRREARAAAALAHPNIATIYALEQFDGEPFLVSEYVPGPTLRELVSAGPLDPRMVMDIATQLARGLAAAHAQGIVHGDLSPANVVRTAAGVVKILDFGIAREGLAPAGPDGSAPAAGTPGYMAPEQIAHGRSTFQSDIFAFGLLVYELAAGRHPFAGEHEPADEPSDRVPLPAALEPLSAVLDVCLRRDPSQRYGSSYELVAALAHLAPVPAHLTDRADAPARRRWWTLHQVLVSALYLAVLAPAWVARSSVPAPAGSLFLAVVIAGATAAATLRSNLLFTSRVYPAHFPPQRRRVLPWIRRCDGVLAAALLLAAAGVDQAQPAIAMLFVVVAVVLVLAMLFIEPTTMRAAFGVDQRTDAAGRS